MTTSLQAAAFTAARKGWRIFPVTPGGKHPAIKAWENRARLDPETIRACWTPDATWNVGIATGPSGLVVVDLDVPKPGEPAPPKPWNQLGITTGADVLAAVADHARQPWPHTHTVQTPTGGLHLYFTAPTGSTLRNTQGRLGWKIDTRAAGGYVLAAGSLTPAGRYVVIDDRDPIPLPHWLADRLTTKPAPTEPATPIPAGTRKSGYLAAAITGEAERIRNAPRGQHNYSIYLASVALGQLVAGRALSRADAHAALRAAAEFHITSDCDCTGREVENTIASGLRAGAKRPRGSAA